MPSWDPALYARFLNQRTRPAEDLATRLADVLAVGAAPCIVDLGCGPGNSTAVLRQRWPGARLTGLDSSPEMIAQARKSGIAAEWLVADAAAWSPEVGERVDAVFANASLQWISDQAGLLARAWTWLEEGGALAVQVPANGGSPLHLALRAAAADPRWIARAPTSFAGLDDAIRYHEPDWYFDVLEPLGGTVDVWETTYWHVLPGRAALIAWYSGTGMRPWLDALADDADREAFKADVLDRAAPSYPERADGSVLFPFRRAFFTAAKIA
jgi:trans-aconitate 2-methyltransferase